MTLSSPQLVGYRVVDATPIVVELCRLNLAGVRYVQFYVSRGANFAGWWAALRWSALSAATAP